MAAHKPCCVANPESICKGCRLIICYDCDVKSQAGRWSRASKPYLGHCPKPKPVSLEEREEGGNPDCGDGHNFKPYK